MESKRSIIPLVLIALVCLLAACSSRQQVDQEVDTSMKTIQLTSPAFGPGEMIPVKYSCDGQNISPPLTWSGAPQEAQSLAVIVDDPDAPGGVFVHWVMYNVSSSLTELSEGALAAGGGTSIGIQGRNDFRKMGYGGPCPPKGSTHRYFFKLYALDASLDLAAGATKAELEKAMQGHILAQGEFMSKYRR